MHDAARSLRRLHDRKGIQVGFTCDATLRTAGRVQAVKYAAIAKAS